MARRKPTSQSTTTKGRTSRAINGARPRTTQPVEHEGATEAETGDRTGPGAGFDLEPEQVKNKGGVST
jgi:hypothetical protein